MEALFPLGMLAGVVLLSAMGAKAAWLRGWQRPVLFTLLAIVALAALFFFFASIAHGGYLPGFGEALIAIGLLAGPGAGTVLGVIAARSTVAAIVVAALSLCGVALYWSTI